VVDVLIRLLIVLLVVGVGWWLVGYVGAALGLPAALVVIAQVVLIVAGLIYLLAAVGGRWRGTLP
jgi:hypothetical protein